MKIKAQKLVGSVGAKGAFYLSAILVCTFFISITITIDL